jgi:adenine deaminase
MTQFLRFPDESAWTAAASEAGFISDGALVAYTHDRAIDVVGTITRGGEYDPETGDVIVPPMVLAGFHVNYSGVLPETWAEFVVEPAAPYRVFA